MDYRSRYKIASEIDEFRACREVYEKVFAKEGYLQHKEAWGDYPTKMLVNQNFPELVGRKPVTYSRKPDYMRNYISM